VTHVHRFFGVVCKAVVPIGMIERDRKQGVASERQPVVTRNNADHAVAGRTATTTMRDDASSYFGGILATTMCRKPRGDSKRRLTVTLTVSAKVKPSESA